MLKWFLSAVIDEHSTWRNQTLLSLELKSNKVNQHPLYLSLPQKQMEKKCRMKGELGVGVIYMSAKFNSLLGYVGLPTKDTFSLSFRSLFEKVKVVL